MHTHNIHSLKAKRKQLENILEEPVVQVSINKYNEKSKDKNYAIEKGLQIQLDFFVEVHE